MQQGRNNSLGSPVQTAYKPYPRMINYLFTFILRPYLSLTLCFVARQDD
jgi:hypothetical protein